jgi:O-antigen/teichoic acid export membrane protein
VFRKLLLIMIPMAAYLAVFAPQVISFLYTPAYVGAAEVFRIYLLLTISRVVLFEPVLASMGRTRVVFLGGVGFLVVDVILNVLFVREMGILGPPWATALATVLLAGFYAWHGKQVLGTPWSRLISVGLLFRVGGIAGIAALAAFPVRWLGWSNFATLIAGAVVLGTAYAAAAYATRTITREDLRLLRSLVPTSGGKGPR